jgi:hypothetical protein
VDIIGSARLGWQTECGCRTRVCGLRGYRGDRIGGGLIVVLVGTPIIAIVVLGLGLDPFASLLPADVDLVGALGCGRSPKAREKRPQLARKAEGCDARTRGHVHTEETGCARRAGCRNRPWRFAGEAATTRSYPSSGSRRKGRGGLAQRQARQSRGNERKAAECVSQRAGERVGALRIQVLLRLAALDRQLNIHRAVIGR